MTITAQGLQNLTLFSRLSAASLTDILPDVYQRDCVSGELVVHQADACEAVYFVVRGVVRARRISAEGREQVLAYLGPGKTFNLVTALDGGPHVDTVDAVTSATLYAIPCPAFRQIMRLQHEVALAVARYLAGEVRRLSDMVEDLALHTVRSRLARFLLASVAAGNPPRRWKQDEIAAQLGTVREMVGRTLRGFAEEGLIRRERGRVVVVDREGLGRVAAGL